ncbi:hypothetical protein AB0D99_28645 [Streptomyces sp. NPDC047971]|uniref:hypothetical protein n=1 Tax=Streptomyces sp. NPDC047971 TaxID=3154499 RepID=UPI0033F7038D
MGSRTPHTVRDPQATPTCPACGQSLAIVAKRHKVLGAWVPEWEVQPCRNHACELCVDHEGAVRDDGGPEGTGTEIPKSGAEAATTHVTGKNVETGRSPATG